MDSSHYLEQYIASLDMVPLALRELLNIESVPCDIYALKNGLFELILIQESSIDKRLLGQILNNSNGALYTLKNEHKKIIKKQQELLRISTRSLSMGNTIENTKKQMNFLTLNMYYLYLDALDNETLNLQLQSAHTLSKVLMEMMHTHKELYEDYIGQKHHYILAQPVLSSLFLLGLLKNSKTYIDQDIEAFFLASLLKDVGMSFIPTNKFEKNNLTDSDKKQFLRHPQLSIKILNGRTPLRPHHLKIIEHHHAFSDLRSELSQEMQIRLNPSVNVMLGFETLTTTIMDIIAAMLSDRPYRSASTLLESLEFVKKIMFDQFPTEFKLIVQFFKKYYA